MKLGGAILIKFLAQRKILDRICINLFMTGRNRPEKQKGR
jgi:hypothetical protein